MSGKVYQRVTAALKRIPVQVWAAAVQGSVSSQEGLDPRVCELVKLCLTVQWKCKGVCVTNNDLDKL